MNAGIQGRAGISMCSKHYTRFRPGKILDGLGIQYETQTRLVGRYHVDFYVESRKLIIECDGDYWHAMRKEHDAKRDAELRAAGYNVLRLSETEIRRGTALYAIKAA